MNSLSSKEIGLFKFKESNIDIVEEITKEDYSVSVSETITKIRESMMESFAKNDLTPSDINRVYITGGTGQSPYIQTMLRDVFGADKLSSGEVYQSVINGLAEYALQLK